MGDESVKVAVRVRPFNARETDLQAKLIIGMPNRTTTTIANPDNEKDVRTFNFDYSYWSHDGFVTAGNGVSEPAPGSPYASQRMVFEDLGRGVLKNAMEGYNCSLFAYGQTGSGKSYSMVGYGANRGIVPITCDELFKIIEGNTDPNKIYQVTFSMLEIYNEQVRDLLSNETVKGGLPIRQNPTAGNFYVQDLKTVPVASYKEIENRMEQGTSNRTIGATNMNATSSRAHTIVSVTFDQITKGATGLTKKSSVINLVDLAGSERANATGATGDRLKEGCNINKSLSVLGNVISALADLSTGKKKGIVVPYRDSVLTMLLKNALGGNSKTVMIAALSPADVNYDETLSTLRYADRAKQIKNKATVNENPMDKLLRELREENDRLKKLLQDSGSPQAPGTVTVKVGMTPEEIEEMKREMEAEIRSRIKAEMKAGGLTAEEVTKMRQEMEDEIRSKMTGAGVAPEEIAKIKKEMEEEIKTRVAKSGLSQEEIAKIKKELEKEIRASNEAAATAASKAKMSASSGTGTGDGMETEEGAKIKREMEEEIRSKMKATAMTPEEIAKIRKEMEEEMKSKVTSVGISPEEIAKMKRDMEEEIRASVTASITANMTANSQMLAQATGGDAAWQQRLKVAQAELDKEDGGKKVEEDKKKTTPYLCNLNEDPLLSGIIVHFIEKEKMTIGRKSDRETPDLVLNGMSILDKHAVIYSTKGERSKIEIEPGQYAKILLNGKAMTERQKLHHKDRILFGSNHLYVFMNPLKPKDAKGEAGKIEEITWDFCQKEIAKVKGYLSSAKQLSKDQQRVQEGLLELLPAIGEANTMAEEMGKRYNYELVLLSNAIITGRWDAKGQRVMVNVRDTQLGNSWLWDRETFINRKFLMQELYQRYMEGENVARIDREKDPFWEPPQDCLIGTTTVYLKSLAYNMDFTDRLVVVDLKGLEEGSVEVTLIPCSKEGRPLPEENFVDEPSELIGKPFNFRLTIQRTEFNNAKYEKRRCKIKYRSAFDTKLFETPAVESNSLSFEFKHSQIFRFEKADKDLVEYLDKGLIMFSFYMAPNTPDDGDDASYAGDEGRAVAIANTREDDERHIALLKQEVALLKRKVAQHQEKERRIKNLVDEWESRGRGDRSGYEGFYKTVRAIITNASDRLAARVIKLNALMRATGKRIDSDSEGDEEESEDEPGPLPPPPPQPKPGAKGILKNAPPAPPPQIPAHPHSAGKQRGGKEKPAMADELKVLVGDKRASVACNVQ